MFLVVQCLYFFAVLKKDDPVWLNAYWEKMYPSVDMSSSLAGLTWIKSFSSDRINDNSKFCGTVGLWSKTEPFRFDAKAQTCAASNVKSAVNICMKEIKRCDSSGNKRRKRDSNNGNKQQEDGDQNKAPAIKHLCLNKHIRHCFKKKDLYQRNRCLNNAAKEKSCRVKTGPTPIEMSFDPEWLFWGEQLENRRKASIKQKYEQLNITHAYRAIFDVLWHTQLPCFDVQETTSTTDNQHGMLKSCHWRGKRVPCSQIFSTMPTDRGMCCSFNIEKAEKLFVDGIFTETIVDIQKRDKKLAFDRHEKIPFQPDEKFPQPMAGKSKGLSVVLDARTDLVSEGSVYDNGKGFVVNIGTKDMYPITEQDSILVNPGMVSNLGIKATSITADSNLRDQTNPGQRMCLFRSDIQPKNM